MCTCPITIKNPNYATAKKLHHSLSWLNETTMYLKVPCGKCHECRNLREDNYIQRLQLEQMYNHMYFFTLTICDDAMPIFSTGCCDIPVAPWDEVTKMFKRIRKDGTLGHFRYFVLNEYGGKNHRPHFHGVILLRKDEFPNIETDLVFETLKEEWRKNVGSTRNPIWKPMFYYKEKYVNGVLNRTLDVSYIHEFGDASSASNALKYALKYTFKRDDYVEDVLRQASESVLTEDELRDFVKAFKPRIQKSLYLGSIYEPLTIHPKRWASRTTRCTKLVPNPLTSLKGDMPDFEHMVYIDFEDVDFYNVNEGRELELEYRPLIYNHLRECVGFSAHKDYPTFLDPNTTENDSGRPLARYYRKFIQCLVKNEDDVLYWKTKQLEKYGTCSILDERTPRELIEAEARAERAYRLNLESRDTWQDNFV